MWTIIATSVTRAIEASCQQTSLNLSASSSLEVGEFATRRLMALTRCGPGPERTASS